MHRSDRGEELLAMPPLDVDTDAALGRFEATVRGRGIRPGRRRAVAYAPGPVKWLAAAAVTLVVATTLGMTGLADSILQIFEAKQFAAVTVTSTDLQTLEQLSAFGTLTWSSQPAPHEVASLAAAASETGLPAPTVTLPAGIAGAARYGALARASATFRFDAATAAASAARLGRTAPPMPARIDGSTLVFTGGPAITVMYGEPRASAAGGGTLVVVVARTPTVASDGVTVKELQAYLLAQPGVSPALAAQLRAIGDPSATLPVPIPIGQAAAKAVSVHGTSGLFVGDSTGLGSGVLWQQNGLVYFVGGTLTEAQTLGVANSLR